MAELPLVLVSEALPEGWLSALEGQAEVHVGLDVDDTRRATVRGLLTMLTVPVDEALLDAYPALKVVSNMAVGYDNVDLAACAQRGIAVGHTPGVLTDATADLAMGLIIAAARGFEGARRDAARGAWGPWSPTGWLGLELRGAALGVVGLGAIGSAVARRARAFGMRIVHCTPSPKPELDEELDATQLPLDALLERADVVSLHCPLGPATHHLIDARALSRMRTTAYLVNTARGAVVDGPALREALIEGRIAGAALDVTEPEPLPPEDPLYALDNCLILPHLGSATSATRRAMAELAARNLLAGVRGEALPHAVPSPVRPAKEG